MDMKTIEVTNEMHKALMELSKEMTTQDNRGTAMPHLFQVQETIEAPAHEGSGEEVFWSGEYELELRTTEDKTEFIKEQGHTERASQWTDEIDEILNGDIMDDYTLDNIIVDDYDFEKFYTEEKKVYSNAFFTSKGCDEHIRINGHNLRKPVNYLNHAFRNAEMELVSKFLCELSGGKLHK